MMTSFGRLKIVKQLDDGLAQSYLVFDPRRGEEVILHILPETNNENRKMLESLEQALREAPGIVIERGNFMGVRYVVGANSAEFRSLVQRFEGSAPERNDMPPAATVVVTEEMQYSSDAAITGRMDVSVSQPAGPAPSAPGEFTRMFAIQPSYDSPQPVPTGSFALAASAPTVSPIAPVQPETGRTEPGEFTRFFEKPPVQAPSAQAGPSTSIPAAPISRSTEPPGANRSYADNERTRLFEMPAMPSPQAPQETKEFAKFFESPLGPSAPDVDFNRRVTPAIQAAPKPAGNFTQMFGTPLPRDSARQPQDSRESPAGATDVFSKPSPRIQPLRSAPVQSGGYTGRFDAPSSVPRKQVPEAPAPPVKPPVTTSTVVIIGVLAALLVLAVALILYFLLRR
jgi:hypothetical protein